ncbi:MAG: shikimate kinase [Thermoplasmata archaeon]
MRGVGTASGAVTVVNALPTGIGCAVAVSLPVLAEVDLRPTEGLTSHRIQVERTSDTALVRETLRLGLSRFATGEMFSGDLRIVSAVPIRKGLKSSSAVGGAVLRAVAGALRQSRSAEELARLAADVAQEIGLSATGAYDDCLAALRGGVALTDNTNRQPIRSAPFDTDLDVALWIPSESHVPSIAWLERFRAEAEAGRTAADAARAGRWVEAMTLNTELVERVMGYDYGALRSNLMGHGATMCGVSGMGPALAVLVPRPKIDAVVAFLPQRGGEVRRARIRPAETTLAEEV